MQKSVAKRIVVTKRGKVRRRAMSLGHNKANKRRVQQQRKRKPRGLVISKKTISKYL